MDENIESRKLHSISIGPWHIFSHSMPNAHESGTGSRDRPITSILHGAVTQLCLHVSGPFKSAFAHRSQKE